MYTVVPQYQLAGLEFQAKHPTGKFCRRGLSPRFWTAIADMFKALFTAVPDFGCVLRCQPFGVVQYFTRILGPSDVLRLNNGAIRRKPLQW